MAKQFYPINEGLIERIKSIMQEKNIRANKLADIIGCPASNLSQILNGKRPAPNSVLERICDVYGIDKEWLQTGKGEMQNEPKPIISDSVGRPYYNVDFAAGFDFLENDQTTVPEYYIDFQPYNKCDCWCHAHGNSMYPTIASGDIVAMKRIEDIRFLINGEIYGIVTSSGLRTIKRIRDNGDTITLIPDNKEIAEQTIPKTIVTTVYQIKGALKQF